MSTKLKTSVSNKPLSLKILLRVCENFITSNVACRKYYSGECRRWRENHLSTQFFFLLHTCVRNRKCQLHKCAHFLHEKFSLSLPVQNQNDFRSAKLLSTYPP